MAFSRKHKEELLAQYTKWLNQSEAVFMLEYKKMGMKEVDAMRAKIRDVGGQGHVVKNTIMILALANAGIQVKKPLVGTTLVGFALKDAPVLAKVFSDATKLDQFELKGGFLSKSQISANDVKALADMPPLPVMRARLLGMLQAPAGQLVRTLAEPARSLAAVVKAYSDQDAATAAD